MGWLKTLGRSPVTQRGLGWAFARYLDLVQRTNPVQTEPADLLDRLEGYVPVIGALWHGQHFMAHFVRRADHRVASLVSRSGDGELNAEALRRVGVRPIRGSGARGRDPRRKGGAAALRAMLRALADGESVVLTADVPKIARHCGEGIVTLARLSGRPIVPFAVATSRRIEFGSWDRASLGLPFGRGAIVAGEPIAVPSEGEPDAFEALRRQVETELDRVNARAFEMVGRTDPGAGLRPAASPPRPGDTIRPGALP